MQKTEKKNAFELQAVESRIKGAALTSTLPDIQLPGVFHHEEMPAYTPEE